MCVCLVSAGKPFLSLRIAFVAVLTLLLSGWTSCTAIVSFGGCTGAVPQPHVTSLSPENIPGDMESVQLIVTGSGFVPQSQILWNGSALQTAFADSRHLRATTTRETLDSFGGSAGSPVEISVRSQGSTPVLGCPNGGNSSTLILVIN
jgi:hypothetical protein